MAERDPIYGHVSRIDDMQQVRVKGTLVASRRRYVLEHHGQQALDAMADGMSEGARRHLVEEPLAFAWFPFEEMMEIDRRIVLGPMDGEVARMKPFGSEIARYDLPTVFRALFRIGTPAFILKRIHIPYRMYLEGGWVKGEGDGPKAAAVSLGEVVFPEYFCRYGMSGWLTAAVELSGGKDVQVEHDTCVHDDAPQCHWTATWA